MATLQALEAKGFQIEYHSHARAILTHDFPDAILELCAALDVLTIPIEEIVAGGGGEAKGTQRLRRSLSHLGWPKTTFTVRKIINGVEREAVSHIVDHCRTFDAGVVALEIEWNNKDPFFDRDLENFKRLHADGAISVGVLVTRGRSLHGPRDRPTHHPCAPCAKRCWTCTGNPRRSGPQAPRAEVHWDTRDTDVPDQR